jgi:hypothetical protein
MNHCNNCLRGSMNRTSTNVLDSLWVIFISPRCTVNTLRLWLKYAIATAPFALQGDLIVACPLIPCSVELVVHRFSNSLNLAAVSRLNVPIALSVIINDYSLLSTLSLRDAEWVRGKYASSLRASGGKCYCSITCHQCLATGCYL